MAIFFKKLRYSLKIEADPLPMPKKGFDNAGKKIYKEI